MSTTTVLISDYTNNKHYHLVFTQDDFQTINDNWQKQDTLLVELSNAPTFKGKTKWCDLQPLNYQVLITRNLMKMDELTEDEQMDENHAVIKSLHFLITGFIKNLEINTDSCIEILRIDRIAEDNINFIHQGSSCLQLDSPKKAANGLKIIVDNTK